MFEPKSVEPPDSRTDRGYLAAPSTGKPLEKGQHRLMVGALVLLLGALGLLLYHDRDFWFPDAQETAEQPEVNGPATTVSVQQPAVKNAVPATAKKQHIQKQSSKPPAPASPAHPPATVAANPPDSPVNATTQRTVLPPLEVEVVAGDNHRTVRPGTNSVHVDLQPGSSATTSSEARPAPDTTAAVTSNAAERVQMTTDTANVVTHSVRPGYPLLARQMKVQGSVILQALISRDGAIQDLHVLSGPPILASAAQEAVKQWRFKPHYLGSDAVETQAKITVNFTISTN